MNLDINFTIKKLSSDDVAAVESLFRDSGPAWASSINSNGRDPISSTEPSNALTLLSNPDVEYYGCYADGELVMSFGSRQWQRMPYYTFIELHSKIKAPKVFKNSLALLLDLIMDKREAEGRHTFYYVASLKQFYDRGNSTQTGRSIFQQILPRTENYVFTTELICRAGELPKWDQYRDLLRYKAPETDVIIRRATRLTPLDPTER